MLGEHDRPYICCCTAYSEAQYQRIALESGMDEFISKPIETEDIRKLLAKMH